MKIQSGCIQTILDQRGRLVNYRLTLPVPYQYVVIHGMEDIMSKPNKKGTIRYFYAPFNIDYDQLEQKKFAAQILVNTIKREQLEARHTDLLSQLSSHII